MVTKNTDQIVLVNNRGKPIGVADKLISHNAHTPLHLAFSCYIFDNQGKFLLTRRSKAKKVWPGVWTNSVCGHPKPNESIEHAIKRRAKYELGMKISDIQVLLPKYRYKTPPFNGIIENEICPVFIAKLVSETKINPEEVESIRWLSWQDYVKLAESEPLIFSWWSEDQLKDLKNNKIINGYSRQYL